MGATVNAMLLPPLLEVLWRKHCIPTQLLQLQLQGRAGQGRREEVGAGQDYITSNCLGPWGPSCQGCGQATEGGHGNLQPGVGQGCCCLLNVCICLVTGVHCCSPGLLGLSRRGTGQSGVLLHVRQQAPHAIYSLCVYSSQMSFSPLKVSLPEPSVLKSTSGCPKHRCC